MTPQSSAIRPTAQVIAGLLVAVLLASGALGVAACAGSSKAAPPPTAAPSTAGSCNGAPDDRATRCTGNHRSDARCAGRSDRETRRMAHRPMDAALHRRRRHRRLPRRR